MLNFDFNTYEIERGCGYGEVANALCDQFVAEEYEILDKSWNVLNFCKPEHYRFKDGWTIGYTPWESTDVPESWIKPMNDVDDLWTTATWVAETFNRYTNRDIFVLPHAISDEWVALRRHYDEENPFTFIHVGDPAVRKGGDILFEAWYKHFRTRSDVALVFKCKGYTNGRIYDSEGSIIDWPGNVANIEIIDGHHTQAELWRLYALSQCLVYPTRGEGFGLIPLEAMATGLPAIYPRSGMGDYSRRFGLTLKNSRWVNSGHDVEHPGKWMDHDLDELIHYMETVLNNYRYFSEEAYIQSKMIHNEYTWSNVVDMAQRRIEAKFL